MWSSILSGLGSGLIGILLGIYTVQKASERQEESIKMEATKDLIYKNRIEWYNDLRKSIAKLVECFIQTNEVLDKLQRLNERADKLKLSDNSSESLTEAKGILSDIEDTRKEFNASFSATQGQIVLVRLYLFNLEPSEADVLGEIQRLLGTYYNHKEKIPLKEMDSLVEVVRILLKKQQDKLDEKFNK